MEKTNKVLKVIIANLPCKLTDEEQRQAGEQLAQVVQDIAHEENRQNDIKAGMKARMAELASRQSQLAIKVARKEEYREAEVKYSVIQVDGDKLMVEEVRLDTGEMLRTRPIYDEERQLVLSLTEITK